MKYEMKNYKREKFKSGTWVNIIIPDIFFMN